MSLGNDNMLEKEKNFKLLLEIRPFVVVEVTSHAASLAWTRLLPFRALGSLACLPITFFFTGFPLLWRWELIPVSHAC